MAGPELAQKKRSRWMYVGLGCGATAFLFFIAAVVLVAVMTSAARKLSERNEDAESRTAEAKRLLGAERLPDGYSAAFVMSLPGVMEMALLSDRAPDAGAADGFDTRGFLYVELLGPRNQAELRDYFDGRTEDASVLRRNHVNANVRQTIRRGELIARTGKALYVAGRGEAETGVGRRSGLQTLVLFQCRNEKRTRLGIWFGEDPRPDTAVDVLDVSGTVADERELARFLSHFDPCGT